MKRRQNGKGGKPKFVTPKNTTINAIYNQLRELDSEKINKDNVETVVQKPPSPTNAEEKQEKPKLMIGHGKPNFIKPTSKIVVPQKIGTELTIENSKSQALSRVKSTELEEIATEPTDEYVASETLHPLKSIKLLDNKTEVPVKENQFLNGADKVQNQQPWIGTLKKVDRQMNSKITQSQPSSGRTSPALFTSIKSTNKNVHPQEIDTEATENTLSETRRCIKSVELLAKKGDISTNENQCLNGAKENDEQPWIGTLKKVDRQISNKISQSQPSSGRTSPAFSTPSPLQAAQGKPNFLRSVNRTVLPPSTNTTENTISQTRRRLKSIELLENKTEASAKGNQLNGVKDQQQPWIGTLKKEDNIIQTNGMVSRSSPSFSVASPLLTRKSNIIRQSNEEMNSSSSKTTIETTTSNEIQEKLQSLRTTDTKLMQNILPPISPHSSRKITTIKQSSEAINSSSVSNITVIKNQELNDKIEASWAVNDVEQVESAESVLEIHNGLKTGSGSQQFNLVRTAGYHEQHTTQSNGIMYKEGLPQPDKNNQIFSKKFTEAISNIHEAVTTSTTATSKTFVSTVQEEKQEIKTDSIISNNIISEKKQSSYDFETILSASPLPPRKSQVFQQQPQPQSPHITKPKIHHLNHDSPNYDIKPFVSFSKDLSSTPNRYPDVVKVIKKSENSSYITSNSNSTMTLLKSEANENMYFSDVKFIINENGEVVQTVKH